MPLIYHRMEFFIVLISLLEWATKINYSITVYTMSNIIMARDISYKVKYSENFHISSMKCLQSIVYNYYVMAEPSHTPLATFTYLTVEWLSCLGRCPPLPCTHWTLHSTHECQTVLSTLPKDLSVKSNTEHSEFSRQGCIFWWGRGVAGMSVCHPPLC